MTSLQSDESSFFDESFIIFEICQYTHSIKISAFYLKWLSYSRKTEISNYQKSDNDVIIP